MNVRNLKRDELIDLFDSKLDKIREIDDFYQDWFVDFKGSKPLKEQTEELTNQIFADAEEMKKVSSLELNLENKESIRAKIQALNLRINLADARLKELDDSHVLIYGVAKDEEKNIEEKHGIIQVVEGLQTKLDGLIDDCTKKLQELTDSSLHNAFKKRAIVYTADSKNYEKYILATILIIVIVALSFLNSQYHSFNVKLIGYQLAITSPLVYLVWLFNRNQNIAKKLAEEYHHKASISEAMTGYRELYKLSHSDPEYLNFFNLLVDQLNHNPSEKIDKFLSRKSPHEKILGTADNAVNRMSEVAKTGIDAATHGG